MISSDLNATISEKKQYTCQGDEAFFFCSDGFWAHNLEQDIPFS